MKTELLPISVVIIAKNEETRIKEAIDSALNWAGEVLVIDDNSCDKTVQIAESLGARVITKKMQIEGKHRNWAVQQAKYLWIFSLDADERLTEELKEEIRDLFKNINELPYVAYTVPRRNFIGNYWMRYGGQYPAAQIKLFRKDKFSWEEVGVHPRAFLQGQCGHLSKDLIHYTYRNWSDYLRKLNNQTNFEAQKWYEIYKINPKKAKYKMNLFHALWRCLDRFVRAYLAKKGYRDGFYGFMNAYFASLYQLVSYAKYREFFRENSSRK